MSTPPAADASLTGQTLGDFALQDVLGRGGMGQVYRAVQGSTKRSVAVKVLTAAAGDAQRNARFAREAAAMGRLNHPNIVTVFSSGEDQGVAYVAMELVDGVTLRQRLKSGRLSVSNARQLFGQLAGALAHAHAQSVVHRDLKPSNIIVSGDVHAKIADFGLAKLLDDDVELTRTGGVMGSAAYMAPEQWDDPRRCAGPTDVYALGCVMYEVLAGAPAFRGGSAPALMKAHLTTTPPSPASLAPELAEYPDLVNMVRACLQREAAHRPTALALAEALGHADSRDGAAAIADWVVSSWGKPAAATMDTASSVALWEPSQEASTPASTEPGRRFSPTVVAAALALVVATGVATTLAAADGVTPAPQAASLEVPTLRSTTLAVAPVERWTPAPPVAAGPPSQPARVEASLRVAVEVRRPSHAHIYVDGQPVGQRSATVTVTSAKPVDLRVVASGYKTLRRTLDHAAAKRLGEGPLMLTLVRKSTTTPPTRSRSLKGAELLPIVKPAKR